VLQERTPVADAGQGQNVAAPQTSFEQPKILRSKREDEAQAQLNLEFLV
jgi:hypothetical protein